MKVKVRDASFAGVFPHHAPGLPQFAFAGRSNVGKSSLINKLLNRKSLVRISKVPGKTRAVNFFRVDLVDHPPLYMVDLPGYGYAKVSKSISQEWAGLISRYFSDNTELKIVMLLVDIRRDLQEEERMLMDLMKKSTAKVVLVATKADKLSSNQRKARIAELVAQSGLPPLITSASTGEGMGDLWAEITGSLHDDQAPL